MFNYVSLVERVEGEGVKRVETELNGVTIGWAMRRADRQVIQVSTTKLLHDMELPEGVYGEMRRQACAVFAEKRRSYGNRIGGQMLLLAGEIVGPHEAGRRYRGRAWQIQGSVAA